LQVFFYFDGMPQVLYSHINLSLAIHQKLLSYLHNIFCYLKLQAALVEMFVPRVNSNHRKQHFFNREIVTWNISSPTVTQATNLSKFQKLYYDNDNDCVMYFCISYEYCTCVFAGVCAGVCCFAQLH